MDYAKLKGDKFSLAKVLARTLKVPLLLPIAPRLALLGFTFCQPFFIETLLNHLAGPRLDPNVGYGLIGASLLIYSGIASSMAFTWYFPSLPAYDDTVDTSPGSIYEGHKGVRWSNG